MSDRAHAPVEAAPGPKPALTHAGGALLQRACGCGGSAGLTGECEECRSEKMTVQRRAAAGAAPSRVPPIVHEMMHTAGQPLDVGARSFMEERLGHDFSRVRVHADSRAAESALAVNALAYTVGQDIVFGAGQYEPGTREGRRLLAHELTHVVQQGSGAVSSPATLRLNAPGDHFEREAERVADALVSTPVKGLPHAVAVGPVRPSTKPPGLQRTARFVDGSVSEEFNLAERLTGDAQDAGNTDFVLNGTAFTGGTTLATARSALKTPEVESVARPGGKAFDCWFKSVPDNEGTFVMKVLKSGRWRHVSTKAKMAALFPRLRACQRAGDGYSTLIIKENDDLRARVRVHEGRHAADYRALFNDVVVNWDNKVTEAQKNNRKMVGRDADGCQKILYRQFIGQGQTPDEIVASIINEINARAAAFHATAEGRKVEIFNVEADGDCNTVKAEAR